MPRRSITEDLEEKTEINLSPMIDCIFILLIFFIVTTVFVEESGLQVNRPEPGGSQSLEEDKTIRIELTADNRVLFNGTEISVNGVQARVKQNLRAGEETPVLITHDETVPHRLFAQVWGEVKAAGAETVSFNPR
ncbi:MAG: ExbD/TolR family protein [Opitutales bacterium]